MAERENSDFAAFQIAATERIRSGVPLLGSDGGVHTSFEGVS